MKKHLETINEVVNLLATHNDGYMRTAHTSPNVFAFIRENPQDTKGLFKITITTACEGCVVGTYCVEYLELEYTPDGEVNSYTPWDVCSGFICNNTVPEHVVNEILLNTEPGRFNDYDYRVVDEIGGIHEDGLGWNPDGDFCGECTNMNCKTCPVWLNKHSK